MVDIWLDYEQNMNVSSIWWGTIFADRNLTAMQKEGGNVGRPGKPGAVPAVSWWQVGDDVLAMTEGPGGERIDVHKMVHLGGYHYEDDFGAGWHTESGPSHEAIGPDGSIYSTANFYRDIDEEMMESKRVVYRVDAVTSKREIIGGFPYTTANLPLCTGMG